MTTKWKTMIVATALLAALAFGLSVNSYWAEIDGQIAARGNGQGGNGQGHAYGNLKKVISKYDDPMRGMHHEITYRDVFQDALWYQINNPQVSEETRVECYTIVGMLHEGNTADLTEGQYDTLMEAVELVWGPAIIGAIQEELTE